MTTKSLGEVRARYLELTASLQSPDTLANPDKIRDIATEQSKLQPIVKLADELDEVLQNITEAKDLLSQSSSEPELSEFAKNELSSLQARQRVLDDQILTLLNPANPDDEGDAIVEIRAAAGGDEAGLFAGDLYRMYLRLAERRGFRVEELSNSSGGLGNIKEVIFKVSGNGAYGTLKYESGVHRVQRVPKTESAGRIHTSTVTVAVLAVVEPRNFEINPGDIDMDAFRSSGAGGQNVNKVNSAVRLHHRPSGLIVTCQTERSQLQNKEKAMEILRSRLYTAAKSAEQASIQGDRKSQIGSGDRSEKIRTYNFPQDRLTDHRLGQSWHNLPAILDGDLDKLIKQLLQYEEKEHS